MHKTLVGTPFYLSPEMFQSKSYRYEPDIWALGIILYELCELRTPFQDANSFCNLMNKAIYEEIKPISKKYSVELQSLVSSLLTRDMERRPSIQEILSFLFFLNLSF